MSVINIKWALKNSKKNKKTNNLNRCEQIIHREKMFSPISQRNAN